AAFAWVSWGGRNFPAYRERMSEVALRAYTMELETNDADQIRAHLAQRHAPSDYVLPAGLQNAKLLGCVAMTWHGQAVSMICFQTDRPPRRAMKSDLWLFIVDQSSLRNAPANTAPALEKTDSMVTASWSQSGRTYVLLLEGEEADLQKFL